MYAYIHTYICIYIYISLYVCNVYILYVHRFLYLYRVVLFVEHGKADGKLPPALLALGYFGDIVYQHIFFG